jgi:hypothetical protein
MSTAAKIGVILILLAAGAWFGVKLAEWVAP